MFRARKGAIAVMSAMMITVFMMLAAVAVDYSRLQHMKTQLKTAADAAALAGALQLMKVRAEYADSAQVYGVRNRVQGVAPTLAFADIRYGRWDDVAGTLDTSGAVTLDNADAVKVTARTPGSYLLARIFNTTPGELVTTSVAWGGGSVGATRCMKPWAIPFAAMLHQLGRDPTNMSDSLTEADIDYFNSLNHDDPSTWINFKVGSNGSGTILDGAQTPIPGNFYAVRLPPIADANGTYLGNPPSGGNVYNSNIGACFDETIAAGAYLQMENGNMVGPTKQGVADLCGVQGAGNSFNCNPHVKVKAAIWHEVTNQFSGVDAVRIKYIGAFAVTKYESGAVYGYFLGMLSDGSFTVQPGPLKKIILVK